MQRLTADRTFTLLAVMLLGAGCGGTVSSSSTSPPSASLGQSQDELTATATESTDVASAALQIGDDEMMFGIDRGFPFALRGRPEIGVVLRALAVDVRLCAGN